jgi:hypothetical protein
MNRLAVSFAIAACGLAGACGGSAGMKHDGAADHAGTASDGSRLADAPADSTGDADTGSSDLGGADLADSVVDASDAADAADAGDLTGELARGDIYVSPRGDDRNPGTEELPVQTLQRAQGLVRGRNRNMTADLKVFLADGFYRMSDPLVLDASDSGSGGHAVIWTAVAGARPVLAGSKRITGWSQVPGSSGIWVAQGPPGIRTRQLYVDGVRATRATGLATLAEIAAWRDVNGGYETAVEVVFRGGTGPWAEVRCPLLSAGGNVLNLVQPCSDNSRTRHRLYGGPPLTGAPTSIENAYALLDTPGEWYLDDNTSKFYYLPLAGQVLASLDVEAPVLEALVTGDGTATAPLHDVEFHGLQFSYATWMGASGPNGFSEQYANYLVWGSNGIVDAKDEGTWYQLPANVSFTYAQNLRFTHNAFVHLGSAGLALGNGAQSCLVEGNILTDISGNAIELGNLTMRNATGANQTLGNTIRNNHIFDVPVEYHGGVGIMVGYSATTSIVHNQIDHTPYSAISIGWGGWPDALMMPPLANYSHNNDISNNLIFLAMQVMGDGGAIYTTGQTSASQSFDTGETITGNVIHDMMNMYWAIYDDAGSDWVTITGNALWNLGYEAPFGYCHDNYYIGEGGGLDYHHISGNYWQGLPANGNPIDPHCYADKNTPITGPADVPKAILDAAGLEPAFADLLTWTQVPPPP